MAKTEREEIFEILTAVRAVFHDETGEPVGSRWTQGASARDMMGRAILPVGPAACCWCLTGALQLVCFRMTDGDNSEEFNSLVLTGLRGMQKTLRPDNWMMFHIPGWNDDFRTNFRDVINMLDHAIYQNSPQALKP